jgi:hypothetical protein
MKAFLNDESNSVNNTLICSKLEGVLSFLDILFFTIYLRHSFHQYLSRCILGLFVALDAKK